MQLDDIYRRELLDYLEGLRSAASDENERQNIVALAERVVLASLDQRIVELAPEVIGGGRPGSLGMILVRKRQRLAYSIKLSNFMRDPIVSASASALGMFAISYISTVAAAPPATFPGFLIGVGFAVFRAFAHPIGYGEAALLHRMVQLSETKNFLTDQDLKSVSRDLVEIYGYAKGANSNEVASLLDSLKSWNAIESVPGGYKVRESVPFGLGPIEYDD